MSRWRVTETRVQEVIVEAGSAEGAKMIAWMATNRTPFTRLSVTHEAVLESSEPHPADADSPIDQAKTSDAANHTDGSQ